MNEWEAYCYALTDEMPHYVYVMALTSFCLGTFLMIGIKGLKAGWRFSVELLLVEYVSLFFASTVIFRPTMDVRRFDFTPLWSYVAVFKEHEIGILPEIIMNVAFFVPIGLLLGFTTNWNKNKVVGYNKICFRVLINGIGLSLAIEIIQFVFKKGFSEVDDIIHNTLGCLIGYGVFYGILRICLKIKDIR